MIDDGEIANAENPDKFWIPPLHDRQSLVPGSVVKIRFYIRAPNASGELVDFGERMWVEIKELHGDWYFGTLDNDPSCTDSIRAGMPLWFQPRHVIDIEQT
jgi:hypothetical protein